MKKLFLLIGLFLALYAVISVLQGRDASAANTCGLAQAAFCDSFDAPSPVTNRSGQLNGAIWGVSRFTGNENIGGQYNAWFPTTIRTCSGPQNVAPPNDVQVCNGQLREAQTDGGTVSVLAMYPKQPFDFAGRTGVVAFDVSNDTQGSHAAWPEFWMSDKPVPAPFAHEASWISVPQHGFGVRFAGANAPGCAGKWNVDSAIVSRNYVADDSFNGGAIIVQDLNCGVTLSNGSSLNHVEMRISQASIEVWATDAGTTSPLIHIATIPNANLSFTRGLVWLEDVHYNGGKFGTQGTHTFIWDNLGFDGPFTFRDASYDVLDNAMPNLGWLATAAQPLNVNTLPIDGALLPTATGSRLMFNYFAYTAPLSFSFTVNGHPHTGAQPDAQALSPKTIAFDVPLTELVAGPNNIQLIASDAVIIANVNIVLTNVSGGVPSLTPTAVISGSPTTIPATPNSTATTTSITPSPAPATPTPISTVTSPTATPSPVGQWQNISPAGLNLDPNATGAFGANAGAMSVAADPTHPGTVYVGTDGQGIWKSTNSGASFARVDQPMQGPCGLRSFDGRNHSVVVDEQGSVYTVNGYGCNQGLFKSVDGGFTWAQILPLTVPSPDVGHIALDPLMPGHILASLHSNHNCPDNCDVPLYESFDHGATWSLTSVIPGAGFQGWVFFLNNSDSWIVASTYTGIYRTTDHGAHWAQVSTTPSFGTTMIKVGAALYIGSAAGVLRSTDNGATWALSMSSNSPYPVNAVGVAGTSLYSRIATQNQPGPMRTSADGLTWSNQAQVFSDGPQNMGNDSQYLYAAMLDAGVWRLSAGGAPVATPTPVLATPTPLPATATATPAKTYRCQVQNGNGSFSTVWTRVGGGSCP